MEIRKVKVSQINPAPYNPRVDLQPGDVEYEKLKRSIETFGNVQPIVWNERNGHLVGGHQRFKIMLENNPEELDVSVVNLNDQDEKTLNIALNKISGSWDEEKLAELIQELRDEDVDTLLTGFDEVDINQLLEDFKMDSDEVTQFEGKEIDVSDYESDQFECECPRCGFVFDKTNSK